MIIYNARIILFGLLLDFTAFAVHLAFRIPMQGPPMTPMMFGFWLMGLYFQRLTIGKVSRSQPPDSVQSSFVMLSKKLGIRDMNLNVANGQGKSSGFLLRNDVFVTQLTIDTLCQDGIDFILGHELAHRKFMVTPLVPPPRGLAWIVVGTGSIGLVSLRLEMPFLIHLAWMVPMVLLIIVIGLQYKNASTEAGPEMELACDFISVNIISNPAGAVEAIEAMHHGSKLDRKFFGYPSKEERLAQVQRFIGGEPRKPFKRAYIEEVVSRVLDELRLAESTVSDSIQSR